MNDSSIRIAIHYPTPQRRNEVSRPGDEEHFVCVSRVPTVGEHIASELGDGSVGAAYRVDRVLHVNRGGGDPTDPFFNSAHVWVVEDKDVPRLIVA